MFSLGEFVTMLFVSLASIIAIIYTINGSKHSGSSLSDYESDLKKKILKMKSGYKELGKLLYRHRLILSHVIRSLPDTESKTPLKGSDRETRHMTVEGATFKIPYHGESVIVEDPDVFKGKVEVKFSEKNSFSRVIRIVLDGGLVILRDVRDFNPYLTLNIRTLMESEVDVCSVSKSGQPNNEDEKVLIVMACQILSMVKVISLVNRRHEKKVKNISEIEKKGKEILDMFNIESGDE